MSLLSTVIVDTVTITSVVSESIWERAEVMSVPFDTETSIITYNVMGSALYLDSLSITGTFAAEFRVYLNATHKETKRIEITEPVAKSEFPPQRLEVGDVLQVKVIHYDATVPGIHDYEAVIKAHR